MKIRYNLQYIDGAISILYFFDADNVQLLVVRKCNMSYTLEYICECECIPDFIECDYHPEHESFIFQESLVWDKRMNFYALIELQKQVKYHWDYLITQPELEIEL